MVEYLLLLYFHILFIQWWWFYPQYIIIYYHPPLVGTTTTPFYETTTLYGKSHMLSRELISQNSPVAMLWQLPKRLCATSWDRHSCLTMSFIAVELTFLLLRGPCCSRQRNTAGIVTASLVQSVAMVFSEGQRKVWGGRQFGISYGKLRRANRVRIHNIICGN